MVCFRGVPNESRGSFQKSGGIGLLQVFVDIWSLLRLNETLLTFAKGIEVGVMIVVGRSQLRRIVSRVWGSGRFCISCLRWGLRVGEGSGTG